VRVRRDELQRAVSEPFQALDLEPGRGQGTQPVLRLDGHDLADRLREWAKFMPLPAPTSITRPASPASTRSRQAAVPRRSESALIRSYICANRGCWNRERSLIPALT
jgi:hypothetical protein